MLLYSNVLRWQKQMRKWWLDAYTTLISKNKTLDKGLRPYEVLTTNRVNPLKLNIIREEIAHMLENDLIKGRNNEWSSQSVLVPKPDGTHRFCTDFRQVNKVTKTDSYPMQCLRWMIVLIEWGMLNSSVSLIY